MHLASMTLALAASLAAPDGSAATAETEPRPVAPVGQLANAPSASQVAPVASESVASDDPADIETEISFAPSDLIYARATPSIACVAQACSGVRIVDLDLALGTPGGPQRGTTRLLVAENVYLGLAVDDDKERHGLSLAGARWDFALEDDPSRSLVKGEYRAKRIRATAAASRFDGAAGGDWTYEAETGFRLNSDFELIAGTSGDDRSGPVFSEPRRPTSSAWFGAHWQRDERLDVKARVVTSTLETPAGIELDSEALLADADYTAGRWRLAGELGLEDITGRFPRQEARGRVEFDFRILSHLLASAEVFEHEEVDLGPIRRTGEVGLTYFVRRHRFERAGQAARQTVALARRAYELGLNETRIHDDEGRRRLRERVALAGRRSDSAVASLAPMADTLYAANVDERNVALAGASWTRDSNYIDNSVVRRLEVFFAVPWPNGIGAHPLAHDETAVDFLRFTFANTRRQISSGFGTEGNSIAVDIAINRELAVKLSWNNPAAAGLNFALDNQPDGQLTARLVYRYGI